MKPGIRLLVVELGAVVIFALVACAAYNEGYKKGRGTAKRLLNTLETNSWPYETWMEWEPKTGDRVATRLQLDGSVGDLRIVTITNVVRVGKRTSTGLMVYGDGLPGVDSAWVKPAP